MSEKLLELVRAEIAERQTELARLREMERLALLLNGEEPERAEEFAPTPVPRPRRRDRNGSAPASRTRRASSADRERAILDALSTRGPLSPAALADAAGYPSQNVRDSLRGMLADGRVTARGATTNRTYDVARNGSGPGHQLSPRVRKLVDDEASGSGEVAVEDQVLDLLRHASGRVALSEIEYQLRKRKWEGDRPTLEEAASRLATHGLVIRDPGGGLRLAPEPSPDGERPLEQSIMDAAGVESL